MAVTIDDYRNGYKEKGKPLTPEEQFAIMEKRWDKAFPVVPNAKKKPKSSGKPR